MLGSSHQRVRHFELYFMDSWKSLKIFEPGDGIMKIGFWYNESDIGWQERLEER